MLFTLPLAAFIAALALAQRAGRDTRYTLLLAAIVWGKFLTLLTEVLQLFLFSDVNRSCSRMGCIWIGVLVADMAAP